jgi:hypothetical protein
MDIRDWNELNGRRINQSLLTALLQHGIVNCDFDGIAVVVRQ